MGWLSGSLYPFLAENLNVGDQTSLLFARLVSTGELGQTTAQPQGQDSLLGWVLALLTNVWGTPWLAWAFITGTVLAVAGIIKRGQENDVFQSLNPRDTAVMLISLIHTCAALPQFPDSEPVISIDDKANLVARIFLLVNHLA